MKTNYQLQWWQRHDGALYHLYTDDPLRKVGMCGIRAVNHYVREKDTVPKDKKCKKCLQGLKNLREAYDRMSGVPEWMKKL